jgi:hypothetical protein
MLLTHSGIADAAPEDKDGIDHELESAARVAIAAARGEDIWSDEQVAKLNEFQASGRMHPFTCETAHPEGRDLVATRKGWICPHCDYTQCWAHSYMFKGAPDPLAAFRVQPPHMEG